MTTMNEMQGSDVIDIRDVIQRVEELREQRDNFDEGKPVGPESNLSDDEAQELFDLESFLSDLAGYGGDEQWEGEWYPVTLIRESYFTEYCEDLVKDIGDMPRDIPAYIEIDWEATARNVKADYSEVEFCGYTYFYR